MSILGDTKLIQIPENPLLFSFRTKTNTLVKDEKTAGTRDIFLEECSLISYFSCCLHHIREASDATWKRNPVAAKAC